MRFTPDHIAKALREYDSNLTLTWDESAACWFFCHSGETLFAYAHKDGTYALNPVLDEVMEVIRSANQRNTRDFWLKAMRRARARRHDQDERAEMNANESCRREAEKYRDFWRRGKTAKPFLPPLMSTAT